MRLFVATLMIVFLASALVWIAGDDPQTDLERAAARMVDEWRLSRSENNRAGVGK